MRTTREPSVSFGTRLSVESDQLRRRLQEKLGLTAPQFLERALLALERELNSVQPAE